MTGLINIGAGLSQMGQALSDSSMFAMKNELDNQKLALASTLATQRQSAGIQEQGAVQAGLQKSQQTFESGQTEKEHTFMAGEQTEKLTSEEKVAKEQIDAAHSNVMAQIGAQGWGIQFDQDTGNPIRVNNITGETASLVDKDGKPLQVVNTAIMPVVKEALTGINQERQANINAYQSNMNSLKEERQAAMNAVTSVTPEAKAKAAEPYDSQIHQLDQTHREDLSGFANRTANALAPLYAKSGGAAPTGDAGPKTPATGGSPSTKGGKPPLTSFYHPAGGSNPAGSPSLLNGSGQ